MAFKCYVVDDVDTFVARDRVHMWQLYEERYGDSYEAMTGVPLDSAYIEELPPGHELTIIDDVHDDPSRKTTKTVAEWIAQDGPGLLCSTEW